MYQYAIYVCISWYSNICWFLVKKTLMSAKYKRCVKWFICFLDLLEVRYIKFHYCRIYVTKFREGRPFWSPHSWAAAKGPSWIRLNQLIFALDVSYIDKYKHVKKNITVNIVSLAQTVIVRPWVKKEKIFTSTYGLIVIWSPKMFSSPKTKLTQI